MISRADRAKRRWAFTTSNAGAAYNTSFYATRNELSHINWDAVAATDFRSSDVRQAKQAEFLVYETFPWSFVSTIGVVSAATKTKVEAALQGAKHTPQVVVNTAWYY